MSSDDVKQSNDNNSKVEELRTIFSEEEIRNTVKAFTLAYFRGTADIGFDNANNFLELAKVKGEKLSYTEAEKKEVDNKNLLLRDMKIVSGSLESTPVEFEESIKSLFNNIINLRAGHRIKGTFLEFDFEQKLDQMDERISATNRVVEEFVNWYIETEKGHDKDVP